MSLIYDVAFNSGTRVLSLLDKAGNVVSSCEVPSKSKELTLTATVDNSSVKLIKNGIISNLYKVDTGSGWTAYELGTVINLNKGQSCKWRCTRRSDTFSSDTYVQFVMTGKIKASNLVTSIIKDDLEPTSLEGYSYACCSLFKECKPLVKAPALPATILAESCYRSMFAGCDGLTQAPELPATILAESCYRSMFEWCKGLTQAPELPATKLADYCYRSMFAGCDGLTQAPELPATILAYGCYYYMLYGCNGLTEVRIKATEKAVYSLLEWLNGVSATGDFYCDPNATIFPTDSPSGIPSGWRRLPLSDYPVNP